MTMMATMAGAYADAGQVDPLQAQPALQPQRPQPQRVDPVKLYERWEKRIKLARERRDKEEKAVWKPLYDQWIGPLARHCKTETELVNALAEQTETLLPHLVGDERECRVKVNKVNPGEDLAEKLAVAETLGDQATALARAVGLYQDAHGRGGELEKAIISSAYSMGVILTGFNPPRGVAEGAEPRSDGDTEAEGYGEPIDLDFALGGRKEKQDAGMPFARHYPASRFLGDATYNDFASGDWCGIEDFIPLAACKKLWPKHRWQKTHACEPVLGEGDSEHGAKGEGYDGLVRFTCIYQRFPATMLMVPDAKSGVKLVVEQRPLDLGIEGLPVLLLGSQWCEHSPYPKPLLARGASAAKAENELTLTATGAGTKIKSGIIVNAAKAPKLAEAIRNGDDNGVYDWVPSSDGDTFADVVKDFEIGKVRQEWGELADRARVNSDRSSGGSDLSRGLKEPGDTTATETSARQEHISARMAWSVKPERMFEAAVMQNLITIAHNKLDLLNGLGFPLGQGPDARLVVFDASQPVIGEFIDYTFEVDVADRVSDADEVNQINNVLGMIPGLQPLLAAEGKGARVSPLFEEAMRKGRTPRYHEVLYDLPPPEPVDPNTGLPLDPNQQPQQPDSAAELEQLGQMLMQVPEGDPQEDEILARMAELQAGMEAQAA